MTSDWPAATGPLTVADLDRTPDDGRRHGRAPLGGARPVNIHATSKLAMARLLEHRCGNAVRR